MARLGFKSVVYHGEFYLGELETIPVKDGDFQFPGNEIRIHHISQNSERCHPLSVLQTIAYASVRCKIEPCSNANTNISHEQSHLINLHASCFYERKTAVVLLGTEEIHLVAMPSKQQKFPCFWCYSVPLGLYSACLWMLNTRCLAIVFDLDETLIVANTMKSFEDKIDTLMGYIARETDPVRESGMTAEMKRYVEDRALLKQYAETDCIVDGGKVHNMQHEEVSLLSDGNHRVVRPVIRLPEKNIVLTRINPENRDTSVLVRLRPAWDELKNYLTARGRKRFEVYVCTMAERDYALEMWRLLDPEAHLISSKQLIERVVCVKSGSKKSLLSVFQDGNCHPKMAMVIDDRMKVWDDIDQTRVHVVPPFTPYFAPQAEAASSPAVLCVARNVACNARTSFFKEFDECLQRRISEIFFEDEVVNLPSAPDDANFMPNGNPNVPVVEGMSGHEAAQRLHPLEEKNAVLYPKSNHIELKSESSKLPMATGVSAPSTASMRVPVPSEKKLSDSSMMENSTAEPSLLGDPFRRDNRYSYSTGPPLLSRLPWQAPVLQSQGGWLVEEDTKRDYTSNRNPGTPQPEFDPSDRQRGRLNSHSTSYSQSHIPQGRTGEVNSGVDAQNLSYVQPNTEFGACNNQPTSSNRELKKNDNTNLFQSLSIPVLQEIGRKCNSKVEFRAVTRTGDDLLFLAEVFFTGEKIGVGMGKTMKDAQQLAAENALRSLAGIDDIEPRIVSIGMHVHDVALHDRSSPSSTITFAINHLGNENGFLWDISKSESKEQSVNNGFPKQSSSEV